MFNKKSGHNYKSMNQSTDLLRIKKGYTPASNISLFGLYILESSGHTSPRRLLSNSWHSFVQTASGIASELASILMITPWQADFNKTFSYIDVAKREIRTSRPKPANIEYPFLLQQEKCKQFWCMFFLLLIKYFEEAKLLKYSISTTEKQKFSIWIDGTKNHFYISILILILPL